jgi:hypothetical protein
MPEEIEVPTEHLHESIKHAAGGHGADGPSWIGQVALTAAILAVAAAITALLAGHHANEAMLEQMKAADQWGLYQAKGIKMAQIETKLDILSAVGKDPREDDRKKIERYKEEQEGIKEKATELETSSGAHMARHVVLARSVTGFQVAIALSAIAVLSRRKAVWFVSLALGVVGAAFLIQGLL